LNNHSDPYWFYIDAYVHLEVKGGHVLFYNPFTGKILEYLPGTLEPQIEKLIKKLRHPSSLQVIKLEAKDLKDIALKKFVQDIRDHYMGDLLPAEKSLTRPMQMLPEIKIQKDIHILKKDKERSAGENVMAYLSDIVLYLNDSCDLNCTYCKRYYRQFLFCTAKHKSNHQLDKELLKILVKELPTHKNLNFHFCGGNILDYPLIVELPEIFKDSPIKASYYIYYKNLFKYLHRADFLLRIDSKLIIFIDFPLDQKKINAVMQFLKPVLSKVILKFVVQDTDDYNQAKTFQDGDFKAGIQFSLFYNGDNKDFFKKGIYISREDIELFRPNLKTIYLNSTLNSEFFGKIIIQPDGYIYADIYGSKLGRLGKDSLADCIIKEMTNGKSWFRTRRKVIPCKQCVYEKLCPPISAYHLDLKQNNLCHLEEKGI